MCERLVAGLLALLALGAAAQEKTTMSPDPQRVREIAALLSPTPRTFGTPIADRAAWDALAQGEVAASTIRQAEEILRQPIPAFTEEIYKAIVKSGSRSEHYLYYGSRPGALASLCLAECFENKGRFLPRLEELIGELCGERTWLVPVRKKQSLDNWDGRSNDIDLNKAMRAWEIALAQYLLDDRLQPATRARIPAELERRVFAPYRDMLEGRRKPNFWLTGTNNWNTVCLAGVTGAALTILDSPEERAYYAVAAEQLSLHFLSGFPSDGYCTEGMGYWNFGFGEYLALAEALWQATDGRLDLFARPGMADIALFGARLEIADGVYPAIADCTLGTSPNPFLMHFMSRRLGLGLEEWERGELASASGMLYRRVLGLFPSSASQTPPAVERVRDLPIRHYFDQAGILLCRPGPDSQARLAVALKGGHNGEHHNHNDVGTFVVVSRFAAPILDIGAEVYTNRTFSARRYESRALNSYGHPVPLVAGTLQKTGAEARARVLRADFSPLADTFVLDLAAAYDVPALRRLERTFVYSRQGDGSLTVTDTVQFATPQTFGTALLTVGHCRMAGPTAFDLEDGEGAVHVEVEASGETRIVPEPLSGKLRARVTATRIGIDLVAPVVQTTITVRITPRAAAARTQEAQIRNGGFEAGLTGWRTDDGMSTLATDHAAGGANSLRIVDESNVRGSDVLSDRFALQPDAAYVLRGRVHAVSGHGVGIYVRLLDRRGEALQKSSAERRASYRTVGSTPTEGWRDFELPFRTTSQTHYGRIWLHTANAQPAEACLDDLRLDPAP